MMGKIKEILALPNDSKQKTLFVAVALCLVCSILVSGAAVVLKPLQDANKAFDKKKNILQIAGLMEEGKSVDELFKQIEPRVIDMATGEYVEGIDPVTYDQRKAANDPKQNIVLTAEQDIAGIKRRAKYTSVYLVKNGDQVKSIILPIHGYGLWSTLYGFLALEPDARTVVGLGFYAHAETPGLGGEVDNPQWRGKWVGKQVYGPDNDVIIRVIKGAVGPDTPDAYAKVDGLSGATLTARGVENMLHYWLSEQGFSKYLSNIRSKGGQS
ncbi:MAG: Na(+)-translocating NADH-quinone reductase subunit C (EC [uncultured Thiotrichaceae bacterium]|uniref:Na(+)-translocating NADH-quinone reductase subunit C n=1 Tax=uncultured Thiotrichaceae bacterium TaxID=298394 RepID=A0A6S6TC25_9GAMM|nr:MAG: Na(+)-translocating NADH-quinone reductase subunit C (EC [uncultured Thiotrichaceae bacterium]